MDTGGRPISGTWYYKEANSKL